MKQNFPLQIQWLGRLPYRLALNQMLEFRRARLKEEIPDTLICLEHEPVITMGRRPSFQDLKLSPEALSQQGIDLVETDRGGKLTYHGPGQLVIYFIVNLEKRGLSIGGMVNLAEEGILQTLKSYQIISRRDKRNPGIWVQNQKIASLGFHVYRGVTTHGIALNVNCDLTPFSFFIPCGISGAGVTSLYQETGKKYHLEEIGNDLLKTYQELLK